MMQPKNLILFVSFVSVLAGSTIANGMNFNCNVSQEHPLFSVEKKTRSQKLENPTNYECFAVTSQDSLEETYRKLIQLSEIHDHFSGKTDNPEIDMSTIDKFISKQCRNACERYPGSAAVANMCFRYTYLASDDLEKMKIIVPFVQERDYVPGISRSIWTAFDNSRRQYDRKKKNRYKRLFGLQDNTDKHPREILELLTHVWASRINPDYSTDWTEQKVVDLEDRLTPEKRHTAQRAWRNLVKACYNVSPAQIKHERQQWKEKRREKNAEEQKKMEKKMQKQTMHSLERLEERPNGFKEIDEVMDEAYNVRIVNKDWGEERLPNYDTIKHELGKNEADILNLFYKTRVLREHKEAQEQLKKLLNQNPEDTRLLMLKAMKDIQNNNFKEAFATVNKIIDIDPEHTYAKNIRERILRTTPIQKNATEKK